MFCCSLHLPLKRLLFSITRLKTHLFAVCLSSEYNPLNFTPPAGDRFFFATPLEIFTIYRYYTKGSTSVGRRSALMGQESDFPFWAKHSETFHPVRVVRRVRGTIGGWAGGRVPFGNRAAGRSGLRPGSDFGRRVIPQGERIKICLYRRWGCVWRDSA